eukprot:10827154-Alexandrium_andersonii.AAC.1
MSASLVGSEMCIRDRLRGQKPTAGSGQLVGEVATPRASTRCSGCTPTRGSSAGGCRLQTRGAHFLV